jgi:hypothetical protein
MFTGSSKFVWKPELEKSSVQFGFKDGYSRPLKKAVIEGLCSVRMITIILSIKRHVVIGRFYRRK